MKRPSFQFYPGDWLNDLALRLVSIGARGLWIDMICMMHQGSEYGYLKVNGKVILPLNLTKVCGSTLEQVEGWLTELESAGVYSIDENGCIYSRRMIRDEQIRKARADGGHKGGNPKLIGKEKVILPLNLKTTPSSSSSSSSSSSNDSKKEEGKSSSKKVEIITLETLCIEGLTEQTAIEWLHRRKERKAKLTRLAWDGMVSEAAKANIPIESAIRHSIQATWQTFNADWYKKSIGQKPQNAHDKHNGFANKDYGKGATPLEDITWMDKDDRI